MVALSMRTANGRLHFRLLLRFIVVVRHQAFCQEKPSALLHKIQVEPNLVMAALINLADAQTFVRNGECTMLA